MNKCCYKHKLLPNEELIESEESCQFDVEELILVDGKYFCQFHCPVINDQKELTEKGMWNDEKIDRFNDDFFEVIGITDDREFTGEGKVDDFRGVVFPGEIDFSDVQFKAPVDFSNCEFIGESYFTDAVFSDDVIFTYSTFRKSTNFYNCRFDRGLDFLYCMVLESINFQYTNKSDHEDQEERQVIKTINMSDSVFIGDAYFDNREFKGKTDFRRCTFSTAPSFYGCELHQETFFPPFSNFLDTSSSEAFQKYRVLRLSMENVRNRVDEGSFFALEQRSLRLSSGFADKYLSLSFIYEKCSLYGTSVSRPMIILLCFLSFFSFNYYYFFDIEFVEAVEFSIQQVVRPFTSWNSKEAEYLGKIFIISDFFALRLIATLQSLVSLMLIALSILAARWRFKRG